MKVQQPKTQKQNQKPRKGWKQLVGAWGVSVSQSPRTAIQKKTKKLKNIKTKTLFPAEVVEQSSFSKNLKEQEQEQMQQFPSSWTLPQFFLLCTYCANNQKTKQNKTKKKKKPQNWKSFVLQKNRAYKERDSTFLANQSFEQTSSVFGSKLFSLHPIVSTCKRW